VVDAEARRLRHSFDDGFGAETTRSAPPGFERFAG